LGSEGSVFKRKDKKWCAKYKGSDGQWKYLYRKTKGEAREALNQAIADRDAGINVTDATVNAAVAAWLEDTRDFVSRRAWINRESLFRCHIKTADIGTKKLKALTEEDVRSFYRAKSKTLAPSTVKRLHDLLNKTLKEVVRRKQLRSNPVEGVPTPRIPRKSMDVLSVDQVRNLLEACKGNRLEGVFVLGACCGVRIGEALSLRVEDVNLERGTINVRRTLWRGETYQTKTAAGTRTIKLPAVALDSLKNNVPTDSEWLFPNKTNTGPVAASNFHRWFWKPMVKRAGLPSTLTYHRLRHGACSLMLNQNVPIPVVSKYLGHATPDTTLRLYSHVIDGMGGLAADGIDDALG
jgi:integrase